MIKHLLYSIGLLTILATGCEKKDDTSDFEGKVALYLVKSYSTLENSNKIIEQSVVTESVPLVYYSDFLSYDSAEFAFELSSRATEAIKKLDHSVHGIPFAIKAYNNLVYTGYFWPGYSSASCDWITMDPMSIGNKIYVRLGYPGLSQGQTIEDKRNDKRIIQLFKEDNKLR